MKSKEIFEALEKIRQSIVRKKNPATPEEVDASLADLKMRLLDENISSEIVETNLNIFRRTLVDKIDIDETALKAEIQKTLPHAQIKLCNLKVYSAMLPYAKLMHEIEKEGNPEEHAYKLSVLFGNEKEALDYLKTFKSEKMMYDANAYRLPTGEFDLETWRKLCARYMADNAFRLEILPEADVLEEFIKDKKQKIGEKAKQEKQEREKLGLPEVKPIGSAQFVKNVKKKTDEVVKKSIELKANRFNLSDSEKIEYSKRLKERIEKQIELTELGIPFNNQLTVHALAAFKMARDLEIKPGLKYFIENGLTDKDYGKFEKLTRKDDDTQIPNIRIDGQDIGYPGFYLMKVEVEDEMQAARAACLGKLTNCCQSLSGEVGEPCVRHGLTSPNGGFYIVCEGDSQHPTIEDRLVGQSWAWRSESDGIVLDSIEAPKLVKRDILQKQMVIDFYQHLGKTLVQQNDISKVSCGASSGISFMVGVKSFFNEKENFKDYTGYFDSSEQRVIYDKKKPYNCYGNIENSEQTKDLISEAIENKEIPLGQNKLFAEMINWALLKKNQKVIENASKMFSEADQQKKWELFFSKMSQFFSHEWTVSAFPEMLSAIQEHHLSIEIRNATSDTPLIWAAKKGYKDICLELIKNGADIHAKDEKGQTPLMVAARAGHLEICEALIEMGAQVDVRDNHDVTALMLASGAGHLDICLKLIDKEADIDAKDNKGYTPLMMAAQVGLTDVCQALIEKGANVRVKSKNDSTPLGLAAQAGLKEICLALVDKGAEIDTKNTYGQTPLMVALEKRHKEVYQALMSKGASTEVKDKQNYTLLMLAAQAGLADICIELIDKGANIQESTNNDGYTSLMLAAYRGHEAVCLELIRKGAHINAKSKHGDTSLLFAVEAGLSKTCLELIENGANIDDIYRGGDTLLLIASRKGLTDVCLALIDKSKETDIHMKDKEGNVPLILAARKGLTEVCLKLIEKGADIHVKDSNGCTPLISAMIMGSHNTETVLALIAKGDDIEARTNAGHTPLIIAAISGNREVCLQLLALGANVHAKDDSGLTASMYAAKAGFADLSKELEEIEKKRLEHVEEKRKAAIRPSLNTAEGTQAKATGSAQKEAKPPKPTF